jgi:hypothetical protein
VLSTMAFSRTNSDSVHSLSLSRPPPAPSFAAAAAHLFTQPMPCLTGGRVRTDITLNGRPRAGAVPKSGLDLASTSRSQGSFVPLPGAGPLGPLGFGRTATDVTIGQRHWDSVVDGILCNPRHAQKRVMYLKRNTGIPNKDSLASTTIVYRDEYGTRTMMQSASAGLDIASLSKGAQWQPDGEECQPEWCGVPRCNPSRTSRPFAKEQKWSQLSDRPRLMGYNRKSEVLSLERCPSAPGSVPGVSGKPWK